MRFPRSAGILLHPTSLPGTFGIGDLGPAAFEFVDLLTEAGQSLWQMLPLGPTGYGDSPYSSFSAFAGNTLLISPEKLVDDGFLEKDILKRKPEFSNERLDFGAVYKWKNEILAKAYKHFSAGHDLSGEFEMFCSDNQFWLDDYALYRAIKTAQKNRPWYDWPENFKLRDEQTIATAREQLRLEIRSEQFYQFLFFRQWFALKRYANEHGVKIIGDIPIFVALDSADVWANQKQFKLNADGSSMVVAGVPPDYFSKTGQLWGNPIYDWDAMRHDGFGWWRSRFWYTLKLVDIVRVDHFRGFAAAWEVPGDDVTAENGKWVDVPGREIFETLRHNFGDMPIIAEDLGVITPDVERLRDDFGFPGMRILQYGFGGDANNTHLPHTYIHNCVAYTGTHDNDTVVGWWHVRSTDKKISNAELGYCMKYLQTDGSEVNWDFIRSIWASVANIAIVPMQDVLGLGNESRMNLPATIGGNWSWRLSEGAFTPEIASRLKELSEIYGRWHSNGR